MGQFAIDLAHALAAVEVVAVLAAVAVAGGPRDDGDDLGPLGAEQVVVACAQRGEAGGGYRVLGRLQRRNSLTPRGLPSVARSGCSASYITAFSITRWT